ncbi:DNA-processing protein DprA [uncultured Subdoligranulum sp.]|uniref:DNA-processing protein DprA n=1 Tax=uncultured Subdoligranulum sp. TaxID=512298 RepID=UPI002601C092|nr:DNA-protecting protein DprA [uncultured Subdoligranulum sp.]
MDKTLAWLWLADAVGSACQYARELLDLWPDPEELYESLRAGQVAPPFCLSDGAAARLLDTTPFDYEERLDHCLLTGVDILTPDDPAYPARLRDLPDLPLVLYVTGGKSCLNDRRYVGMIGTRRPSAYGRQAAYDLSLAAARQDVVIVSGLADGLDSEGHRAAVAAGVPTIAFLGTAIDVTYPAANGPLRRQIEALGGAVCSEYPPQYQGKTKGTFLARNRLIAAQAEVLCVAEARLRSGTLNTVSHAEDYGRPVLAVPGSIYSTQSHGTNELLRTHRAEPLCEAADIFRQLGLDAQSEEKATAEFSPASVSADARAVYARLGPTAQGIDALCAATGLPAGRVLAACTELELCGGAQAQPGRRYIAL